MKITKQQAQQIAYYTFVAFAAVGFGAALFYAGYHVGTTNPQSIVIENVVNAETGGQLTTDFKTFWEAWSVLKNEHLKGGEAQDLDLLYGAIRGLTNSLDDPHTIFLPPEDSKKFEEDVTGNFGGIGAEIGVRDDQLVVIAPLKDNPAEKVGLKAGDKILAVNGDSTQGLDVNEAVKKIRGEIGTEVSLTIFRDGWDQTRDFKIVRANIQVPTLDWEPIERGTKKIAHVKLYSFNQNAPFLFYKTILAAFLGKSDAIVLDLRNNPGGFLEVAVNLAGWFLDKGSVVVSEKFRSGEEIVFRANGTGALKEVPTVILVNKGSASASEILAGALRDHLDIKLVGNQTFGKGTVQELRPLSDNSKIKLTIANWVLPDGGIIEEEGLKPDYEVEVKEGDPTPDPQLEKAIEVLLEQMK